jgi:hypothetical protein
MHAYHDAAVPLTHSGTARVAVVTYDQRPYVQSGEKEADFVGLSRAGFGNTFDIRTESGHDLAFDFTKSACLSLAAKGYRTAPVHVEATEAPDVVLSKLAAARGERAVIIAIHEWKSDTYNRTGLSYHVTIKVLDQQMAILGQARLEGRDNLGGSFWNPPAHAEEAVPDAFALKLQWLLNHPEVAAALQSP